MDYKEIYKYWTNDNYFDEDTKKELKEIENNESEIEDRFYRDLEFGTAGLRGKLAAGTNRMNIHIVKKVTQGLANYILRFGEEGANRGVAIAFDSRHFSKEFAKASSEVLAANNIKVYVFDELRPTPELSYTVRELNCISGIVITASHNPRDYNGYKVYWEDGAQIGEEIAKEIIVEIDKIKDFKEIKLLNFDEGIKNGLIKVVGEELDKKFIAQVEGTSLNENIDKNIKIVYSPLNGTGNKLVRRVLNDRGFKNVFVVKEQENPDPDFSTVGYPNPEDIKAFKYSEALGHEVDADILIATDPDCDRVATMVKDVDGSYVPFTGNQTGAVLIEYILNSMKENNKIPKNGLIIKSIVTGEMGTGICKKYGVTMEESFTGFKNIFSKMKELEDKGYNFIMGFEESIGYAVGTFVRDKDAVTSSMLLCEACAYYKLKGLTLIDVLENLYKEYGYLKEKGISLVLEGIEGQDRIKRMMTFYRENFPKTLNNVKVTRYIDYNDSIEYDLINNSKNKINFSKSNVLRFFLEDGSWYALRPSGTEPKIKLYLYSNGNTNEESNDKLKCMGDSILNILNSVN